MAGTVLVTLLVLGIAAGALRHILASVSWEEIRTDVVRTSWVRIGASIAFTIASYLVLTGYDVVSLRILRRRVPYRTAALASFTSYIFSHNFGFAALTGGIARWRIYRQKGLDLSEVAQIMVMTGVTFWMGVLLLLGVSFLLMPGALAIGGAPLRYAPQAALGGGILLLLGGYVVMIRRKSGQALRLFGWTVMLPTPRIAAVQFLLAALDLTLATAALFVLVPGLPVASFPMVMVAYLLAFVAGLIAHAPGGVGVFEAMMLLAMPDMDRSALFAGLLVFRCLYYFLPLFVGIALFFRHEWKARGKTAWAPSPRKDPTS